MASPLRSTVTIDGNKFDALSSGVRFSTLKDRAGVPEMGSLATATAAHKYRDMSVNKTELDRTGSVAGEIASRRRHASA
jgi:hypothetical protein